MKQIFDLIEAMEEATAMHLYRNGVPPKEISFSPASYQRLVRIKAEEHMIGSLIIGCEAIREIETSTGTVELVIDEMLTDTEIETA